MKSEKISDKRLAHIAEDGREQSISEHLTETARLAELFARPLGETAQAQARMAGMAHDIGKYSDAFRKRLLGGAKTDHATAGAYECFKTRNVSAAFAVMGHHGGLPDGGGRGDTSDRGSFWGRIKRAKNGEIEPYDGWEREITLPDTSDPKIQKTEDAMFYVRMLYSCLVDADFLDTERFMSGKSRTKNETGTDTLWLRFQNRIDGWFPPQGELNKHRCAVLEKCISEGERRERGLFTLTVPTGGGKTAASLAFALAHAKKHGLRRVIYVIPYTSIIEQTAEVFREILGEENVLEHHSNIQYETDENGEATPQTVRMMRAAENWDMPVVVTTAVRFFESLFASHSSQCRKLHNIAGSVVIFDEAQMLPLHCLRPCVWAISQLVAHCGVTAVLCTATQPALDSIFAEFGVKPIAELCPTDEFRQAVFRRVKFRRVGSLTWKELAAELSGCEQVLCIVNARKSAQTVFSMLEGNGCYHLSTLMYPAHRQAQLKEIRRRLARGLPCRVVSTSLIEAGLDSVLQSAGRCNREGKRPADSSVVTVFRGEDRPPKMFETAVKTGCRVMEHYDDITAPETIDAYFKELLDLKGTRAQDTEEVLTTAKERFFPFRTIADKFHMIDSNSHTVYIPREEGEELVGRLREGERGRDLFRSLGRFGVEIYANQLRELWNAGALEKLDDGIFALTALNLYDEHTGLSQAAEYGEIYIL